jgi:hypothetical protein
MAEAVTPHALRDVDDLVAEAVIIVSSETIWPTNPAATIV